MKTYPWRQQWHSLTAAVVLGACATGCERAPSNPAAGPTVPAAPVAVRLAPARRGDITRNVSLPATLAANQQVALYAKVGGYLKTIRVDKGDRVAAGDLLAEIEVPELLADAARFQAELDLAALEYQRAQDGWKKSPDLVIAQTVDTAKAKLAVARANLDRARTLLDFCRLTAPFAGTVTRRSVDPGAYIPAATAGSAATTPALLSLADFSVVRVQVAVPESEAPFIRNGLGAKVVIEELTGGALSATVTRFSPSLDESTRTLAAELDLPNPQGRLLPGMYAIVKLGVETRTNALLVPVEALVVEKAGTSVFTVAGGKAVKQAVKTGFNDGMNAEVTDGLPADANVVLVGKLTLTAGQALTVVEGKP